LARGQHGGSAHCPGKKLSCHHGESPGWRGLLVRLAGHLDRAGGLGAAAVAAVVAAAAGKGQGRCDQQEDSRNGFLHGTPPFSGLARVW